ncbi:putative dolichyl-diphosphooligosaccharide-protein glycotransferase [Kockovaella imperatae]|uniref:Putative dolichyl-diphosphooligosaccharide-protein glycotransferase n=1 Tax=Kockovaella imperatae TaxID=4999 RepID=A0A1Y1U788_9TREE|nr:putative dolichyl-diphosphooligosaccharide-protein glycotransferase [Kockovaella imperatae]ORX33868.1 putative dolichyl-diphosphooligosaccharide-protein glycotransferase [Kockovaella imperatae]
MLARLPILLAGLASLALPQLAAASDRQHWAALAAKSKDGVITLDSASYEDILSEDRDYSVSVVLTALPQRFKCTPCHEFDPSWHRVANSWNRISAPEKNHHFFAKLDFQDGEAVFRKMGLSTAPKIQFHPVLNGPFKANKIATVTYEIDKFGLSAQQLHSWIRNLTPIPFDLHTPFNPVPVIMIPLSLFAMASIAWSSRAFVLPIIQSKIIWGISSVILILTFTSGYMWNKIKNTPYVVTGPNGQVSWFAGGYSNQLGLESQVVAGAYGALSLTIVALTIFVPAQASPSKQRVGVYLWLAMFVVIFSLLVKLFRVKNESYPYKLLF